MSLGYMLVAKTGGVEPAISESWFCVAKVAHQKTKGFTLDSGFSGVLSKGLSKWVYRLTLARWYYNYAWGWVIGYFLHSWK